MVFEVETQREVGKADESGFVEKQCLHSLGVKELWRDSKKRIWTRKHSNGY